MDVSSAGSAPIKPFIQQQIPAPAASDNTDVSGPDQDNDQDNTAAQASAQSSPPAQSPPPYGTGAYVDKTA